MKTKILLFIVGLFIFSGTTYSQESEGVGKDFLVAVGITGYQIRDQLVSKIRHQGNSVSLGLSKQKIRESSIREMRFNFIFNPLKSRYENERRSMATNLSMNYGYLMKVAEFNEDLRFYLGPVAGMNWHLSYYEDWDESHAYWVSTYFAGIDGRLFFQTSEKVTFHLDLNIPLAVLVSRPPERFLYKELDPDFFWIISRLHDDMKITSVHQHFELNSTLGLIYAQSEKFKPGLFWRFAYLNNNLSDSREVDIITHTFGFYLVF